MLIGWYHRLLIDYHQELQLQLERSLMLEIFLEGGRVVAGKAPKPGNQVVLIIDVLPILISSPGLCLAC